MFAARFAKQSKNVLFALFKRNVLRALYPRYGMINQPRGEIIAIVGCLGQVGHNETKAQSEAFLLFSSVTHWFLSYRAVSVSDTPYLAACNGVRRLGVISLVTSNVGSETVDCSVACTVAITLSTGERASFSRQFDSFSFEELMFLEYIDASRSRANY